MILLVAAGALWTKILNINTRGGMSVGKTGNEGEKMKGINSVGCEERIQSTVNCLERYKIARSDQILPGFIGLESSTLSCAPTNDTKRIIKLPESTWKMFLTFSIRCFCKYSAAVAARSDWWDPLRVCWTICVNYL